MDVAREKDMEMLILSFGDPSSMCEHVSCIMCNENVIYH